MENIGKSFGNVRALENVSFQIRKGEILGFLGPNGAGKTTAMRILAGYFPPSEGTVWIGGEALSHNPARVKRRLGNFWNLSATAKRFQNPIRNVNSKTSWSAAGSGV
jgi:ABC-type multidrug transport system ATPase subunit